MDTPEHSWMDRHAWHCGLILAAGCLLVAWGLHWAVAHVVPGLNFAQNRPEVFGQTLRVPVLFFAYLGAALAVGSVLWRVSRISSGRMAPLVVVALALACGARWATPDMAADLSPMPDAMYYSSLASRVVSSGQWTVPIGPHELPSRYSPGVSLLMMALQWIRPEHPGMGIGIIWLSGIAAVLLVGWLGARVFSPRIGVVAALLLASSPSFGHYTRMIMADVPWSLLVLAALASIYRARDRRGLLFAGGLLLALGMLFKPPHGIIVVGAGLGYLAYMFYHPKNRWRNAALIGLGFGVGLVPWLAYNRLVLGTWILSGYHLYDCNRGALDAVFGLRYLFGPPISDGFMGNLMYYPLAMLGLEPHTTRMLFLAPVALGILAGLGFRLTRRPRTESVSDEGRWLVRGFSMVCAVHSGLFLFYFCQDTRFLLPVLPLFCLCLAVWLDPFIARLGPKLQRLAVLLMILVAAAMGAAIFQVEWEGQRHSNHATRCRVHDALAGTDVLVTDEDPSALGFYRIWTTDRAVLPAIPQGFDWFGDRPDELRRQIGTYMTPFIGLPAALKPHLESNQKIAVWLRRPRESLPLLDYLKPGYELQPWGSDLPFAYWLVRSGTGTNDPAGASAPKSLE